ncbi:hypothetical protein MTR67_035413 [Solanum verrucosum]|uniref:Uncharacterized protein n=1 Tax=Solanum verrucosum TaxID=315347 RepID=A0AAF0UA28_SOLVR|nr:hypothetical protein MTR67_035413 [Solanum verrucosum]
MKIFSLFTGLVSHKFRGILGLKDETYDRGPPFVDGPTVRRWGPVVGIQDLVVSNSTQGRPVWSLVGPTNRRSGHWAITMTQLTGSGPNDGPSAPSSRPSSDFKSRSF